MPHTVRPFQPDDAACVDDLWRQAFSGFEQDYHGADEALAIGSARLAATGWRILVAESRDGSRCAGAVRSWDLEGVGWFDLLVAAEAFAGRALVRDTERWAQGRGIRSMRVEVPPDPGLAAYFSMLGYREIGVAPDGMRTLERRLPLLTVREQRRADADAIAALTGADPWPFTQGARPGWFVLADGERVVGAVFVRESAPGIAAVDTLAVLDSYRGRGLEPWMLLRAATWAATNGAHTVIAPARFFDPSLERDLEDLGYHREGADFVSRDPARRLQE
jgi:GNAT superfamily N-acetyltransferase